MDLDSIRLSLYRYKFKDFSIIIDKKTTHDVEKSLIFKINIVEDYDKYFLPYFEIDIAVPNKIHRKMVKNKDNMTALFHLYKGKFKNGLSQSADDAVSFKKCLNGSFHIVMRDSNPDLTEDQQKQIEESENKYGQLTHLKLLLYNKHYYNRFNLIVNNCLKNVTLADAMCYCLNKTKMKNVLFSPAKNTKEYKQFILTPIRLRDQLNRICNTYQLHEKGSIVFFGLDCLYIIDKQPKCTAWRKNEFKVTYLLFGAKNTTINNTGGAYSNSKEKFNVANATSVSFANEKEILKNAAGSNIVAVNGNGKITKTNKNATKITKVIIENEGNTSAKSIKRSFSESKRVLTAGFTDVDINMFTPNKQFIFSTDNSKYKKYNGKYRLTKISSTLEQQRNYFVVRTNAEFKG